MRAGAWLPAVLALLVPLVVGAEDSAADIALVLDSWAARAEPGALGTHQRPVLDVTSTNEVKLLANLLLYLYQTVISPQDLPTCIFTPTCSEYARLAIRTYALLGLLMASDRLQRCNRFDRSIYPVDRTTGRYEDPVP